MESKVTWATSWATWTRHISGTVGPPRGRGRRTRTRTATTERRRRWNGWGVKDLDLEEVVGGLVGFQDVNSIFVVFFKILGGFKMFQVFVLIVV